MYDPIMRVLTVLEILQARERVTGSELAARLEVNLRTVQRYIVRLQDLSIPVESMRGAGGFYRLRPGFRLPPLMFTDEEAFALALGLRALRQMGLSAFAPATEGAAAKLGRVLPTTLGESIQMVEQVIAVEPGPWVISTSAELLIQIASAIRLSRRIGFGYRSHAGEESRRQIEPYGLLHVDGRWYLIGRCLARDAVRTFRLDRVVGVKAESEVFTRPGDFDVRAYFEAGMPFVESAYQVDVWIDMAIGEAVRRFAPWRVAAEEDGDGTRLRCNRDQLRMFAAMLLSMGRRLVVREPPELRETFCQIAQEARQAAENVSKV